MTWRRIFLQDKTFEVIGILEKEGSFMIDSMIVMNERDSRNLFDRNDGTYDIIVARFNANAYSLDESQEAIEIKVVYKKNGKNGVEKTPESVTVPQTSDCIFQLKWKITIDNELYIQNKPKKTWSHAET